MYNNQMTIQEEQQEQYRQELGLKKMLYKYEHQNQQLKSQIKALTARLQEILAKRQALKNNTTQQQEQAFKTQQESIEEYHQNMLKEDLRKVYIEIEKINAEIKINKDFVNQKQLQKYTMLENQIKKHQREINKINKNVEKYQKIEKQIQKNKGLNPNLTNGLLGIDYVQKLKSIENQLEETKRKIRQMQKYRNEHDRHEIKKHTFLVNLTTESRKKSSISQNTVAFNAENQEKKKGGGIWHMEYTQQNYQLIRKELDTLKEEKHRIIENIKNQNLILRQKLNQLRDQEDQLHQSRINLQLPLIQNKKQSKNLEKSLVNRSLDHKQQIKRYQIGPKDFQRNNDKNYVPKKSRKVAWQSSSNRNGVQWQDSHLRSPISGINLWLDGCLLGLQFLHNLGQSSQHLHLIGNNSTKNISPIQYRLSNNDYLQNVILSILESKIVGIQLISKNGRNDVFGINKNNPKIKKFNFEAKAPEKVLYSYGIFKINKNNVSEITQLGFEIL